MNLGQETTRFSSEGFKGPVLTLLSGSTVILIISYLAQPILTRLYTPEEFGILEYFSAIVLLLNTMASFGYADALMQPKEEEGAAHIGWLTLWFLSATCLASLLLIPFNTVLAEWLAIPALAVWIPWIIPALFFLHLTKLAELWLTRLRAFKPITSIRIANTSTVVSTRLLLGSPLFGAGAGGLIAGILLGHAIASLILIRHVLTQGVGLFRRTFHIKAIYQIAVTYRRFPLFSMPAALINFLVQKLPVFLIPFFFDAEVLGYFGQAFRVLAIPLGLIGAAVAQVFFVHAAEALQENKLTSVTVTVYSRLISVGLFPTVLLMVTGPDLFEIVFGTDWRPAGQLIQVLAPWFFLGSLASPLTRLFDVLERQRLDLLASIVMLLLLVGGFYWGGRSGDMVTMFFYVGLAGTLARLIQLVMLLSLAQIGPAQVIAPFLKYSGWSVPLIAITGVALWFGNPWITTIAAFVTGCAYAALLLWKDQWIKAAD